LIVCNGMSPHGTLLAARTRHSFGGIVCKNASRAGKISTGSRFPPQVSGFQSQVNLVGNAKAGAPGAGADTDADTVADACEFSLDGGCEVVATGF
jgi:hypothetical protein